MDHATLKFIAVLSLLLVSACDTESGDPPVPSGLPTLVVHKNESCGCCRAWVHQMRQAGFPVDVRNESNLGPIKERVGIPAAMGSCHTAEVGGYFVEGHVPAEDVKQLLAKHPKARGLTVPGMPVGSPGMESSSGKTQPYDVYLVANDGTVSIFAHHGDASIASKQ